MMSNFSLRTSTILPLPSSPHWAPRMTADCFLFTRKGLSEGWVRSQEKAAPMLYFTAVERCLAASAFARHGEVEIGAVQLLGEKNDLADVILEVADDLVDGDEDRGVTPCAVRLRIYDFCEARGRQSGDDLTGFVD